MRQVPHGAVPGRADCVLHLHRLEDEQDLAALDGFTLGHEGLSDPARHRREQVPSLGAGSVGCARPGELVGLPVTPDEGAIPLAGDPDSVPPTLELEELPRRAVVRDTEFDALSVQRGGAALEPDLTDPLAARDSHAPTRHADGSLHGSAGGSGPSEGLAPRAAAAGRSSTRAAAIHAAAGGSETAGAGRRETRSVA